MLFAIWSHSGGSSKGLCLCSRFLFELLQEDAKGAAALTVVRLAVAPVLVIERGAISPDEVFPRASRLAVDLKHTRMLFRLATATRHEAPVHLTSFRPIQIDLALKACATDSKCSWSSGLWIEARWPPSFRLAQSASNDIVQS